MSQLRQTAVVETPYAQAADLVERFFSKQADKDGVITVRLAVPGAGLEIPMLTLERDVVATFERRPGPNETVVFRLHWEPAGGGLFPAFDGTLTVAQDETYQKCRLVLEGSYRPPLGVAGAAFNAAIGSRVANRTANALLERVRSFLNRGYQEVEREKRLHVLLGRV